jgi:DNA adenine methylase
MFSGPKVRTIAVDMLVVRNRASTENNMPLTGKSLLRYPGGKTRGVEAITQYFPEVQEMVSPFFGGGSIELCLAAQGVRVYGYDLFEPLVEFWQCVQWAPRALADKVQEYFPLSRTRFYELQRAQTLFKTNLERAAVYYVLNRSSFSGATLSGGMSPDHPRFTQTAIERLRGFHNPNFTVQKLHFKESIQAHQHTFLYLDPPYLIASALYGKKGDTHRDFDHKMLFCCLQHRNNWILSYNDCPEIREMYGSFTIIEPEWKYGMSSDKWSKEVLIFSKDLAHRAPFGD